MTAQDPIPPASGDGPGGGPDAGDEHGYLYRDAGIRERRGPLPPWLVLVAVGLIVWGIYYLIRYWAPPAA